MPSRQPGKCGNSLFFRLNYDYGTASRMSTRSGHLPRRLSPRHDTAAPCRLLRPAVLLLGAEARSFSDLSSWPPRGFQRAVQARNDPASPNYLRLWGAQLSSFDFRGSQHVAELRGAVCKRIPEPVGKAVQKSKCEVCPPCQGPPLQRVKCRTGKNEAAANDHRLIKHRVS